MPRDLLDVVEPTAEEIAAAVTARQNAAHPASWSWDSTDKMYVAPSNPPNDGRGYIWDEDREAWVLFSG